MNQSFDFLRRRVLKEVEAQREHPISRTHRHMSVLAEFVQRRLSKLHMSNAQFVYHANLPRRQGENLVQGLLPQDDLTDEALEQVAQALACEVNLIKIILERTITMASSKQE